MKNINLDEFELLKKRTYVSVDVYRGENTFLRVGSETVIKREIDLHRRLLKLGFPLPKIIKIGRINNRIFFEEESIGSIHFGKIFAADFKKDKKILDKNFESFLKVAVSFARAQIKITSSRRDNQIFFEGTHLNNILKELPGLKYKTLEAWKKIVSRTKVLPFVLTHGDFGPFNIYPKGVIDLESFFKAPLGYDLVTAIYMTNFFPIGSKFEMRQLFQFSVIQRKKYFEQMDRLFKHNGLPKLSDFLDEFILVRCAWATARMQKWPKIQKWRYNQYKKLLEAYLKGEDLENTLCKIVSNLV